MIEGDRGGGLLLPRPKGVNVCLGAIPVSGTLVNEQL